MADSIGNAPKVNGSEWVSVPTTLVVCVALFFATSFLLEKKQV